MQTRDALQSRSLLLRLFLLFSATALAQDTATLTKYHINFKIFEPYFQDDYHISKNLTVNLGVRISFYGTFWERNHLISNWTPSAYDPTLGFGLAELAEHKQDRRSSVRNPLKPRA